MWKVKRMNTARIVDLTIANGAGGIAAFLASRFAAPGAPVAPPHAMQPKSRPADTAHSHFINLRRRRHPRRTLRRRRSAGDADATERTDDMKCGGNQPMMRTFIVRALSFSAVAALTLNPALTPVVAGDYRTTAPAAATDGPDERAPAFARDRQIHRDRPAARHQGCAGRRPQDRQRRRSLRPARLYYRRGGGPDQHRILRFVGPADRGL